MSDSRPASIYLDDIEALETAGELLFRYHENDVGIRLLAIALRLRGQTGIRQAGVFQCDPDESAGLAEVVELHGYSRKTPCA